MMHVGLSITPFGHHPAAWRRKSGAVEALGASRLAAQVETARDAGFDFVLFCDRHARRPTDGLSPQAVPFEPTTLVSALATIVAEIGFVATAATGQHEPYNLARRFASLDLISGGRSGWNVAASEQAFDRDAEYVEVVNGLWDSWEDDAFVYDKAAGRFFRPERMHVLHHAGAHFTVRGPLNVNRSPQGRPVVAHVATPPTMDFAARYAEVIFVAAGSPEETRATAADLRRRIAGHGRMPSQVRIMAAILPWVGRTNTEAQGDFDALGPMPSPGRAENPPGYALLGTAAEIADAMQTSFEADGIDGFVILPPLVPDGLDDFVRQVVPELRQRGLLRAGYAGTTLRDHLGLDRPAHPITRRAERRA